MSYRSRARQDDASQRGPPPSHPLMLGSSGGWGPRTGHLLERPQIHNEYTSMGRENSVMNEHACMPNNVRKMLDVLGEEPTMVSTGFFRRSNVERVHALIIEEVARASRGVYKIGRQSEREVEALMLLVYENNASSVEGDSALDKVQQLNRIVASEATGDILVAVSQYLSYMKQITSPPPTGPERPEAREQTKSLASRPLF